MMQMTFVKRVVFCYESDSIHRYSIARFEDELPEHHPEIAALSDGIFLDPADFREEEAESYERSGDSAILLRKSELVFGIK